jgi:UDP-N-acetylglucosamine--N-acetylmuramyl-(pentapeptide) pyrophosphoryl-undecaprenol N-acetylglucosamine transferase
MRKSTNILISGGGTGGHIFPAIAIANGLRAKIPEANILFVGAKGRMEMEKVPQAGYPIEGLWISGLQRKLDLQNLSFPFKLLSSLVKANQIINAFKPDVVIGTGGYASGPLLYVASKKKIPTLILEQNSYPGITNKLLGKTVSRVCVAYEGMEKFFLKDKILITGSPIRKEINDLKATKEEGVEYFNLNREKTTILVIGGSQGAMKINEVIGEKLDDIVKENIQMIWQTGKASHATARDYAERSAKRNYIKVIDFISRMDLAYAVSDLVISRAGAIAIAEIVAVNKPAIFIPLPSAAEDHQTKNAMALVKGHAAILVKENEAKEKLVPAINEMLETESNRLVMVQNLKRFKHPDATETIVNEIIKMMN